MMLKDYIAAFTCAARAQGVGRMLFHIAESASHTAVAYDGELEKLDISESSSLFIEGEVEGFVGSVFVEDYRQELIDGHIRVLRDCALEGKRPFLAWSLPALPELEGENRGFHSLEEMAEKLIATDEAAQAVDSRIKIQECGFHEHYGTITLTDGEGNLVTDRFGYGHARMALTARQGEDTQAGGRALDLPWGKLPDLEDMARQAAEDTISRLDAASYPTGASPVVLAGKVSCELLDAFAPAFFGHNVQKHMSVLEGRLGRRVAGENITLLEDPAHGLRCRRFDDEGTPTSAKAILDKGILQTYLHNRQSAAKEGIASSGNGFQSKFTEEISVGYTNLILASGEKSQEELLSEMAEGLLITHVSGVFAGVRPTTGEFSLIAQGFQVYGGRLGRAVSQITIAGDFFEMLRQVRAIGCDGSWMHAANGCVRAPSLYVASLAISGGNS